MINVVMRDEEFGGSSIRDTHDIESPIGPRASVEDENVTVTKFAHETRSSLPTSCRIPSSESSDTHLLRSQFLATRPIHVRVVLQHRRAVLDDYPVKGQWFSA